MYRDLGIEWLPNDAESVNGVLKCRIMNTEKNDIYTLLLDDSKMSPVQQANQLWNHYL